MTGPWTSPGFRQQFLGSRPPLERTLHVQVADYLRAALRVPTTWTTIAHGGRASLGQARLWQRQGLRPGWPDMIVMHPAELAPGQRRVIVLGIEMKTLKGRQSVAQVDVEADFRASGAGYALCRSVEDVQAALDAQGIPVHVRL
jgi:hypothetical protein